MTGADDPPTQPNTVQSPDNGFMVTKTNQNPNQGQQYSHSPQAPLPSQECLFNYLTETRILNNIHAGQPLLYSTNKF